MKAKTHDCDEDKISFIIETWRKDALEHAEECMYKAFEEIRSILQINGMWNIHSKKVNGISSATLKEIYMTHVRKENLRSAPEESSRKWFIEFIKAQRLSYEMQKARYPNFLKPWTSEDEKHLKELWYDGATDREIAEKLKRHPKSIIARRLRMGLTEDDPIS